MYDSIEGKVTTISPDAIYSDNNIEEPYFEIRIETNKNYFQGKTEKFLYVSWNTSFSFN